MHGELKLESELGLGATFIIWFDRSEQGETLQDEARQTVILPQAPIDVTEQKPYHILVVDDNQDLLNYLRMLWLLDIRLLVLRMVRKRLIY